MASLHPAGRIDQRSDQGKALQQVIQAKLKDFLGKEYADDVLPLYIVVMLAHGNEAALVADNLEAFLGKAYADQFTQWCAYTIPWKSGTLERHHDSALLCGFRLFAHLSEAGDAYMSRDDGSRSAESSASESDEIEDELGVAMDEDEPPQPRCTTHASWCTMHVGDIV